MISKSEFYEWKESLVTKAQEEEAKETVIELTLALVNRRESNPSDDQFIKGWLQGVQAVMDWRPEFPQEEINAEN